MMSYEGVDIAKRLNEMGINRFVLKYRLRYTEPNAAQGAGRGAGARGGNGSEPAAAAAGRSGGRAITGPGQPEGQNTVELARLDGPQAVRIVRQHAAEFGVRSDRVGMIGFSAGGGGVLAQ